MRGGPRASLPPNDQPWLAPKDSIARPNQYVPLQYTVICSAMHETQWSAQWSVHVRRSTHYNCITNIGQKPTAGWRVSCAVTNNAVSCYKRVVNYKLESAEIYYSQTCPREKPLITKNGFGLIL